MKSSSTIQLTPAAANRRLGLPGILILTAAAAVAACFAADQPAAPAKETNVQNRNRMKLEVTAGNHTFTATLEENATARAFQTKLPATLQMTELNGNEKLFRFPAKLPANPSNPGTIRAGDLMLYGENTLVLFYETFPTSYSYTRIGRISDPARLSAALGAGNVSVTFKLQLTAEAERR